MTSKLKTGNCDIVRVENETGQGQERIFQLTESIKTSDPLVQCNHLRTLSNILGNPMDSSGVANRVMNSDELVTSLINCLSFESREDAEKKAAIILESTLILAYATSKVNSSVLIKARVCSKLVRILEIFSDPVMLHRVVWLLANVTCDMTGHERRNLLTDEVTLIPSLIQMVEISKPVLLLNEVARTIQFLSVPFQGIVSLSLDSVKTVLHGVIIFMEVQDTQILEYALSILTYVSTQGAEIIGEVLTTGILPKVAVVIEESKEKTLLPLALSFIGAMLQNGDESQVKIILEEIPLSKFSSLITHPTLEVRKLALISLSALTGKSCPLVKAVFEANLFSNIVAALYSSNKEEELWATNVITNALLEPRGSSEIVIHFLQLGICRPLFRLVLSADKDVQQIAKEATYRLLELAPIGAKNSIESLYRKMMKEMKTRKVKLLQKLENKIIVRSVPSEMQLVPLDYSCPKRKKLE